MRRWQERRSATGSRGSPVAGYDFPRHRGHSRRPRPGAPRIGRRESVFGPRAARTSSRQRLAAQSTGPRPAGCDWRGRWRRRIGWPRVRGCGDVGRVSTAQPAAASRHAQRQNESSPGGTSGSMKTAASGRSYSTTPRAAPSRRGCRARNSAPTQDAEPSNATGQGRPHARTHAIGLPKFTVVLIEAGAKLPLRVRAQQSRVCRHLVDQAASRA